MSENLQLVYCTRKEWWRINFAIQSANRITTRTLRFHSVFGFHRALVTLVVNGLAPISKRNGTRTGRVLESMVTIDLTY